MRRVIAALAVAVTLSGCSAAEAAAPVRPAAEVVPAVQVEELDPAETGKCMGRYIRVEVPEVPAGTPDPDKFLQDYYDVYTRAYCEEIKRLGTLEV